jgi:DNA-binding HxlR family transcriptional regulator
MVPGVKPFPLDCGGKQQGYSLRRLSKCYVSSGKLAVRTSRRRWPLIVLNVSALLVVTVLGDWSKRFNELRRGLGSVSQRMLTLTLKGLERDGLVTRTVFPTIPRRVDYELPKPGHSLLEPVSRLGHWARQNRAAIQAARRRFDAAKAGD